MKIIYVEYNGSELINKKEYTGNLNRKKDSFLLVEDKTLKKLILPITKVNCISFNPEKTWVYSFEKDYNEEKLLVEFNEYTTLLKPTLLKLEVGINEEVKETKLPIFNFTDNEVVLVNGNKINKSEIGVRFREGEKAVLYLYQKDYSAEEVINLINFYKGVIKC